MEFHDPFTNGQAKADPTARTIVDVAVEAMFIAAEELLEHLLRVIFGQAGAVVGNFQRDLIARD